MAKKPNPFAKKADEAKPAKGDKKGFQPGKKGVNPFAKKAK